MDGWKQTFHKYLLSLPEPVPRAGSNSEVPRTYEDLLAGTPLSTDLDVN